MSDIMYSDNHMTTVQGLGDIYKDSDFRTRKRLSFGLGIKAPTGTSDTRNSKGDLTHMMMQAGTNAWDGLININSTLAFGEHEDEGALWLLSPSIFYQWNTRNSLGYKVGNRLNYDISARYRRTSTLNLKLDFNGVKSASDSTDGTLDTNTGKVAYQNVSGNVLDNVANTGIHSMFISPGFQWLIGDGYTLSGEYRLPIYQNATGIQQVTDHWLFLRLSSSF